MAGTAAHFVNERARRPRDNFAPIPSRLICSDLGNGNPMTVLGKSFTRAWRRVHVADDCGDAAVIPQIADC
jgi:hypothetical protein